LDPGIFQTHLNRFSESPRDLWWTSIREFQHRLQSKVVDTGLHPILLSTIHSSISVRPQASSRVDERIAKVFVLLPESRRDAIMTLSLC
jgi:hypothetical protein